MEEVGEQVSNGEQNPQKLTIPTDLKTELAEIHDPKFSTLGHGTRSPDVAERILKEGLTTQAPDLLSTSVPLIDNSKTWEEQADGVINQIKNWPHLKAGAVIIVMIPNPDEGEVGGKRYFDSVFQELPDEDKSLYAHYYIPRSYIKGYVDVDKGKFIKNPNFNPEKPQLKSKNSIQGKNKSILSSNIPSNIPIVTTPETEVENIW